MKRIVCIMLTILVFCCLNGCGSESNTGQGKTVYMNATLLEGKTGAAFATYSSHAAGSPTLEANSMNFSIHSYVYPGTTNILASDIEITAVAFTYMPIVTNSCVAVTLPNNIWTSSLKWAGRITPNGDHKIENVPIFTGADVPTISTILDPGAICAYDINATFYGREVNTGATLTDTLTFTGMVFR